MTTPNSSAPPRIAIISNEPTPYRLHVLSRLANELSGVEVHNIFTHTISNPSMPWQMSIDPRLHPVFFSEHRLEGRAFVSPVGLRLFGDIRDYLLAKQIRLVILLGYNDLARLRLISWGKKASVPILLNADSNVHADDHSRPAIRPFKKALVRWVLARLAGLMPMGSYGVAYFRRYADHGLPEFLFPYEPDYAALRGVDPAKLAALAQSLNLDPGRKRLLYCGRLVDIKGVDVLLRAFAIAAPSCPDWDLVVAGDGPSRDALRALVGPDLQRRVLWLGFLQFEQIASLYHLCHALVHPALVEPWGLVINEAVACDLSVIATSVVGAAAELVKDGVNGLVVQPGDVDGLARAIRTMTSGSTQSEMRSRCPQVLQAWRDAADPVAAVRKALAHFRVA